MGDFLARGRLVRLCLFSVLALLAAACSSDAEPDVGAADSTTTTSVAEASQTDTADAVVTPLPDVAAPAVAADVGVDDDSIRIGYSLDLSGPLSSHDALLLDGHFARFELINATGGIAGRTVELIAMDNGGDATVHAENVGALVGDSADGVVAIGGLSQPGLDFSTAAASGSSTVLTIGNRAFGTSVAAPDALVPLRPPVCADTTTGLAALVASGDGDRTQLAILSGNEDWSQESAEVARLVASELELEIVADLSVGPDDLQGEDGQDIIDSLVDTNAELVWVATGPPTLSQLADFLALVEDPPSWVWGGPSANAASTVFDTLSGPSLANVYRLAEAGAIVDDPALGDTRAGLAEYAPGISYANAGPALLGWEQADLLVAVLEEAALAADLTRPSLASIGLSLAPEVPEVGVYRVELISDRSATLAMAGSSGFEEVFTEADTPNAVAALCSS